MAGNTDFPTSADVFSANTPTPTTTTTDTADSTGRKHAERHDDAEAALMAVEDYLLNSLAYTTDLGAVTGGSPVTVTHNLGTYDVAVQIVEKSTAGAGAAAGTVVDATISLTSINALTVTFTSSAAANLYRVTVLSTGGSVLRQVWQQISDKPLTTLTGLTTYSGTWTLSTYVTCAVATSTACRAFVTNDYFQVGEVHIVEAEVEIPASGFTDSNDMLRMGFSTINDLYANSFGINGGIRGDGAAYLERDGTAALGTLAGSVPSAGTWVKIRLKWIVRTATFVLYLDGVEKVVATYGGQPFTLGFRPYFSMYANNAMSVRMRNLKAWSLINTQIPEDPA